MQHVKIYREELERLTPESKVNELHWKAENVHSEVANLDIVPLNKLWIYLHLFIALLGMVVVVFATIS